MQATEIAIQRLRRFAAKPKKDKWAAVTATIRQSLRSTGAWHRRRPLRSRMAMPGVLLSRMRYYVSCRPDWDVDFNTIPESRRLAGKWIVNNEIRNAGDLPRYYALLLNLRQVLDEDIPGDLAELGVYRGNSAAILADFARRYGRTVFLFDTFEGFSTNDFVGTDARTALEFDDTSLDLVRSTVGDDSVVYVKGYFPETVSTIVSERRYAIVHLDCDLYGPMKAGLEFFYDRLSPGGIIIIHDYANPCWKGIRQAVDEFQTRIPEGVVVIPDKSGTAIIRKSSHQSA